MIASTPASRARRTSGWPGCGGRCCTRKRCRNPGRASSLRANADALGAGPVAEHHHLHRPVRDRVPAAGGMSNASRDGAVARGQRLVVAQPHVDGRVADHLRHRPEDVPVERDVGRREIAVVAAVSTRSGRPAAIGPRHRVLLVAADPVVGEGGDPDGRGRVVGRRGERPAALPTSSNRRGPRVAGAGAQPRSTPPSATTSRRRRRAR